MLKKNLFLITYNTNKQLIFWNNIICEFPLFIPRVTIPLLSLGSVINICIIEIFLGPLQSHFFTGAIISLLSLLFVKCAFNSPALGQPPVVSNRTMASGTHTAYITRRLPL